MVLFPMMSFANYTGERILKAAQKYGMTDSELNYLIDNTAPDLTLKDPQNGATALIYACVNNRPNMVRILIERGGVDINEVDNNGETCLIGASRKGNIEVIKILLEFNANTSIVGNLNKSAFDYAVEFGHTEVARLLGGPPKQKVSFKTISKLAIDKKRGTAQAPTLESQKYLQDLGKISMIVERMKPVPGGKGDLEKLNEVGKTVGFSEVVKNQMQMREKEEEKLRLEQEAKRAKAKSVMMAKLKAIAAFNNLYLDVSSKNKGSQKGEIQPPGGTSKLSFSDATSQLMNDMELKLKKKEEEIEKEKEMDIERGATERINAIKALIYAGSKDKNIAALKNESPEKLKEKIETIQDLLDVKESKQIRSISLQTARKKINVINALQSSGRDFQEKIKAAEIEDQKLRNQTLIQLGEIYKRKQEELARNEEIERENFYKLVQQKAQVAKFSENLKKKSGVGQEVGPGVVSVEEEKVKGTSEFAERKEFDEVRGVIVTPDFLVWPLTSRDCQIKKNPRGTFYVIISKLKLSKVVQTNRKEAIWFVNTKEKPTPPNGGLECKYFCKDPAIFVGNLYNNPRREIYLSNLVIQLGIGPLDSFEIYSSVPGNKVVKVPITECKMAF